jgi:hypothetical protein
MEPTDNLSTATAEGKSAAKAAGYRLVRVEALVLAAQVSGTVPLETYYGEHLTQKFGLVGDHFTTATAAGRAAAQQAGYRFVRIEGYALPASYQPGNYIETPLSAELGVRGFDASTGELLLRVKNGLAAIECVEVTVRDRSSGAILYGPRADDTPFIPEGAPISLRRGRLDPGDSALVALRLGPRPTTIAARAMVVLYAGDGRRGQSARFELPLDLPPTVAATMRLESYDPVSGRLVFRVGNPMGGAALEAVEASVVNLSVQPHTTYLDRAFDPAPFLETPDGTSPRSRLSPGGEAFLRFSLPDRPVGVILGLVIRVLAADDPHTPHAAVVPLNRIELAGVTMRLRDPRYDPATKRVTVQIDNPSDGAPLVSVRIVARRAGEELAPTLDNAPFLPSRSATAGTEALPPGWSAYLAYSLAGKPTGVEYRLAIRVYSGDDGAGGAAEAELSLTPEPRIEAVAENPRFIFSGSVRLAAIRITTTTGSDTLQSVRLRAVNINTGVSYEAPPVDAPFHPGPSLTVASATDSDRELTTSAGEKSLGAGAAAYLLFDLNGRPTGVDYRFEIDLFTADQGRGGTARLVVKGAPPALVNAKVQCYEYQSEHNRLLLVVENPSDGAPLESVRVQLRDAALNYDRETFENDAPFRPLPTSVVAEERLPPGREAFLSLDTTPPDGRENPQNIRFRAAVTLFASDHTSGASRTVRLDCPPPTLLATPSFDSGRLGYLAVVVTNDPYGTTVESARLTETIPSTGQTIGPQLADRFRVAPSNTAAEVEGLAPGERGYLVFPIQGPTGVERRLDVLLSSANGGRGEAAKTIVWFTPTALVHTSVEYSGYDPASNRGVLGVTNAADGDPVESVDFKVSELDVEPSGRGTTERTFATLHSDTFRATAAIDSPLLERLDAGKTGYLYFEPPDGFSPRPGRATVTAYSADARAGGSHSSSIDFSLPATCAFSVVKRGRVLDRIDPDSDEWAVDVDYHPSGDRLRAWSFASAKKLKLRGDSAYSAVKATVYQEIAITGPPGHTCGGDLSFLVRYTGTVDRMGYVSPVGGGVSQYAVEIAAGLSSGALGEWYRGEYGIRWKAQSDPSKEFLTEVGKTLFFSAIGEAAGEAFGEALGSAVDVGVDLVDQVADHLSCDEAVRRTEKMTLRKLELWPGVPYRVFTSFTAETKVVSGGIGAAWSEVDFYHRAPHACDKGKSSYADKGIWLSNLEIR